MRDAKNSEMKKMLAGTIALLVVVASVGVYQKWFSKTSKFDEDHIGECYYQEIQEEHFATDDLTMYTDNEILLVTEDGVKKRTVEKLAKNTMLRLSDGLNRPAIINCNSVMSILSKSWNSYPKI